MTAWDDAFDVVVKAPLRASPRMRRLWSEFIASGHQAKVLKSGGLDQNIGPDSIAARALLATFSYARHHADAVRKVLDKIPAFDQRIQGQHVVLVDIGAGIGTFGAAVAEHVAERGLSCTVEYVGIEHHPALRIAGGSFLGFPGVLPAGSEVTMVGNAPQLKKVLEGRVAGAVVVFGFVYVLRQPTADVTLIHEVVSAMRAMTAEYERVRFVSVDANTPAPPSAYGLVRAALDRARRPGSSSPVKLSDLSVTGTRLRFPNLLRSEPPFRMGPDKPNNVEYYYGSIGR